MDSTRGRLTLEQRLECQRLEHRMRRVHCVITALEDRVVLRSSEAATPPALAEAVRDFSAELSRLDHRLDELRHHRR